MPANLLIFDADYVSELTARMNTACELFAEAVTSLKSATNHDNWKCKERARIADDFDELNLKLGRLNTGVNETTRILGGSVSRFASLESQYESQANTLSDELTASHGFTASVRTGGGISYGGGASPVSGVSGAAGAAGAVSAGTLGASAGQESGKSDDKGQSAGKTGAGTGARGSSGGLHIHADRSMFSRRTDADKNTGSGANSDGSAMGGGSMMSVNLPVTHIPDSPGAAAKGTKDAQAIADAALSSVAGAITEALSAGNLDDVTAARLSETYSTGRSIFEASSAIIANPSQPHTSERLTMATGIVVLAHDTGNFQGVLVSASGNLTKNAELISSALQDNNEASELRSVLGALSVGNTSGNSASGSSNRSFLDMIIDEIKKIFSSGNENFSSSEKTLASSSPITEFLGSFVMDQAV